MDQKVILIGNLGNDPEIAHLDSGVTVAKFSVATSETWKTKDGEKKSETSWHRVELWRGVAEVAEKYLKKGSLVKIEGKIKYGEYVNKEGQKVYTTTIKGEDLLMFPKSSSENKQERAPSQATNTEYAPPTQTPPPPTEDDEDLPF